MVDKAHSWSLRYLEHYEFRLVREALKEREVLMHMAPSDKAVAFCFTLSARNASKWLLRLGLLLYDNLGGRNRLEGSVSINLKKHGEGKGLKRNLSFGFEYRDCFVDDSRLTIANALAAAELARIAVIVK